MYEMTQEKTSPYCLHDSDTNDPRNIGSSSIYFIEGFFPLDKMVWKGYPVVVTGRARSEDVDLPVLYLFFGFFSKFFHFLFRELSMPKEFKICLHFSYILARVSRVDALAL